MFLYLFRFIELYSVVYCPGARFTNNLTNFVSSSSYVFRKSYEVRKIDLRIFVNLAPGIV